MAKLDASAVRKAIVKGQAVETGSIGPGGRPRTGTKAFVREHLETILRLRDETRATWKQMVAALGAQHDLRQGDGKPITGRRLSALVSACLAERVRTEAAVAARASRADLTRLAKPVGRRQRRDKGRGETQAHPEATSDSTVDQPEMAPVSEDDIRRAQRERHQHLFKRG